MTLSRGNKKMTDTLIFNLPAKTTCPFATEACGGKDGFCYTQKAERQYPSVLPSRLNHFEESKQADFTTNMIEQIKNEQRLKIKRDGIDKPYEYFRIHESGDFYNQAYVNKWIEIAKALPDIKFLAYTKSYPFDFSQKPNNLIIRYSLDSTTRAVRTDLPLAIVQDEGNETTSKNGKKFDCEAGMKCHECRICWNSPVNVTFQVH